MQLNYRSDKYILHLTKLSDENIANCKKLFPELVQFEDMRSLFVVPKYMQKNVMINEYNKFKGKKSLVGENGWELIKRIYSDVYIQATDHEMERFYEKYIKHLKLRMDADGTFYISME